MIDNLYAGITARYTGSSGATLRGLLTGGLWANQAPDECSYPYIVMNTITNIPDNTLTEDIEFIRIQFTIWHNVMNKHATGGMKAIYEALRALYDEVTLTVTGWDNFKTSFIKMTEMPTEDKIIGRAVDYELYIEKQ